MKVLRYVAAQDSGRVMNELTYENQTQGGIVMGLGLALTEGRILDRHQTGKMVNRNWHDYKIPTAMDVPVDQTVVPIDLHDYRANTTAAKGLGEPATVRRSRRLSPMPSTTRAACGLQTRPSTRRGSWTCWPRRRRGDESCFRDSPTFAPRRLPMR